MMPHLSSLVFPVSAFFFKEYVYNYYSLLPIYLCFILIIVLCYLFISLVCLNVGKFEIPGSLYCVLALIIDKIYENLYNANYFWWELLLELFYYPTLV